MKIKLNQRKILIFHIGLNYRFLCQNSTSKFGKQICAKKNWQETLHFLLSKRQHTNIIEIIVSDTQTFYFSDIDALCNYKFYLIRRGFDNDKKL